MDPSGEAFRSLLGVQKALGRQLPKKLTDKMSFALASGLPDCWRIKRDSKRKYYISPLDMKYQKADKSGGPEAQFCRKVRCVIEMAERYEDGYLVRRSVGQRTIAKKLHLPLTWAHIGESFMRETKICALPGPTMVQKYRDGSNCAKEVSFSLLLEMRLGGCEMEISTSWKFFSAPRM